MNLTWCSRVNRHNFRHKIHITIPFLSWVQWGFQLTRTKSLSSVIWDSFQLRPELGFHYLCTTGLWLGLLWQLHSAWRLLLGARSEPFKKLFISKSRCMDLVMSFCCSQLWNHRSDKIGRLHEGGRKAFSPCSRSLQFRSWLSIQLK